MEHQAHDILSGTRDLDIVDEIVTRISGQTARRMDLTYRHAGTSFFARRWVLEEWPRYLEIVAACALRNYAQCIDAFDALEDSIQLSA